MRFADNPLDNPLDRYGYGYDPGKTLKLHLPEGYDMGATSTTDLEPLSDHGAPPRVRRIAAAHIGTAALCMYIAISRLAANT